MTRSGTCTCSDAGITKEVTRLERPGVGCREDSAQAFTVGYYSSENLDGTRVSARGLRVPRRVDPSGSVEQEPTNEESTPVGSTLVSYFIGIIPFPTSSEKSGPP